MYHMNRGVYWRTKLIKLYLLKKNLIVSIVESVHINTKVVGSNPVHGEVYSIQHYVIKFVSDLRQVCGFLRVLRLPPPIKLTATI